MRPLLIEDSTVQRVALRLAVQRAAARRPSGGATAAQELGGPPSAPDVDAVDATGGASERLLQAQPEILAFLMAGTGQLGAAARAVAVLLGDVILECFRVSGRRTGTIGTAEFVTSLRVNREMAVRVGQAHDRFAERYLRNSKTLRQPALIRYVTSMLLEPDATCRHSVPRSQLGPLFIVLKSVIDVLDRDWAHAEAQDDGRSGAEGDAGLPGLSSDPA